MNRSCKGNLALKMCKCIYLQILSQGTKPLCFYLGRALFLPLHGQKMPCILNHFAVIYLILQKMLQKMWTAVSLETLQREIQHSGTSKVSGIWLEGAHLFGLFIMSQIFGYSANIIAILPQNEQCKEITLWFPFLPFMLSWLFLLSASGWNAFQFPKIAISIHHHCNCCVLPFFGGRFFKCGFPYDE